MGKYQLSLVANQDPWKIWVDTVYFMLSYEKISDAYHRTIDIDQGQTLNKK